MNIFLEWPWLEIILGISVLGNVFALIGWVFYCLDHADMIATSTDFRYYMRELVPTKYHVQKSKEAKLAPRPDTIDAHHEQQVFQQL